MSLGVLEKEDELTQTSHRVLFDENEKEGLRYRNREGTWANELSWGGDIWNRNEGSEGFCWVGTLYSAMGPGLRVTGDASWSQRDHLMALLRRLDLVLLMGESSSSRVSNQLCLVRSVSQWFNELMGSYSSWCCGWNEGEDLNARSMTEPFSIAHHTTSPPKYSV